jgi:lipopolysaccharide transport system ATP-binding protein
MSCDAAIVVRGLAKAYHIYVHPADRLKQAIVPRLQRAARPLLRQLGKETRERSFFTPYWALRPLSLTIARGETLGIIGRNGSGKSTLLQLICGTLTPTAGEVVTHGRVAALLELGSGFNPEFTGRENVYLNASVLGLSRAATEERLGEILAFADIGEFIDRPIKTYSSGMTMRLAFSVIAHVDAEILVIDEALAVGDAFFQQKCLRWLRRFRETGTVLFCGHDTGAVISLCTRAVWLDRGSVEMVGPAKEVCEAYGASIYSATMGLPETLGRGASRPEQPRPKQSAERWPTTAPPALPIAPPEAIAAVFDVSHESADFGSGLARITTVRLTRADGAPLTWIAGGEQVLLTVEAEAAAEIASAIVGFHVKDRLGQPLLGDNTMLCYADEPVDLMPGDALQARFAFYLPFLASGRYSITAAIASGTRESHVQHHWLHDALMFDVHSAHGNGVLFALPMSEISLRVVKVVSPAVSRDA